ncbi:MAG TPA: MupA/Atu3671 family FMN-dependent luciferase-like monooxygenase, partial [Thermoanaerobaculia bacterium]
TVQKLWRGEPLAVVDGAGKEVQVRIFPQPARRDLPAWVTIVNNPDTYRRAGELGAGVLTNLMGQSVEQLEENVALYRQALAAAGHAERGHVTLLLHTFVDEDRDAAIARARRPFYRYLQSSLGLLQNLLASEAKGIDLERLAPEDLEYMLELAYQRYVASSALIGSPESCLETVERLRDLGVDEIACLVDFGVENDAVLAALPELDRLRRLTAARREGVAPAPAVSPPAFPLTHSQGDVYAVMQMGEGALLAYNELGVLRLTGALHVPTLRAALQRVIDRHEALRSVVPPPGEVQRVGPPFQIIVPLVDLTGCSEERREAVAATVLADDSDRPFDLGRGPLTRVSLLRLTPSEHLLSFAAHHLVADGLSTVVVMHELFAIYEAMRGGVEPRLAPPMQFRDYVAWLAEHESEGRAEADLEYWLEQFAGPPEALPVFAPPTDRPRPAIRSFRGGRLRLTLGAAVRESVLRLARRQRATPFVTLLAAYAALLHRFAGQDDLVVGVATARRPVEGGDRLVGHCVDLAPMRSRSTPERPFGEHLKAVGGLVLEAFDRSACPFARVLRALKVPRDLSRAPLVNVLFNLDQDLGLPRAGGLALGSRSPAG